MKSPTVPDRSTQGGFTLVEIVAGIVIATIVAAYAVPRMLGPSDFAAKITADRVLAALHYAQTLAQRQGVATSVVVANPGGALTSGVTVNRAGVPVSSLTQNYDGTNTANDLYNALLHPDVTVSAINVTYRADGIPASGVNTYGAKGSDGTRYKIKVETTGAAHFE